MYRRTDDILQALKQGDDSAFRQVYEANRDKFLNFSKRYQLTEEDAVDIYQDAYIVFYNNIVEGKIKQFTSSISTYLFSIGKHLIYDRMRKNKLESEANFDFAVVKDEESLASPLDFEDVSLTEEQLLVQKHFGSLGKKCQELLTLFYYRGYTIKDILDLGDYNSENVVKSQKSRCMKNLRDRINASSKQYE
ncbi:RNA polymerase sigma factor [Sinomicrobium sp.]